ncbi:hypothetical protein [Candidatus Methylacidithermus pantelleriae]|nr:hypothetical protein [Candidatus Methylacidithermus pantelleriae]
MRNQRNLSVVVTGILSLLLFASSGYPSSSQDEAIREQMRQARLRLHQLREEQERKWEQAIAAMNAAGPQEKLNAVVAVLNQLAEERRVLRRERKRLFEKIRELRRAKQTPGATVVPPGEEAP